MCQFRDRCRNLLVGLPAARGIAALLCAGVLSGVLGGGLDAAAQHAAHEHGVSRLDIALEGTELLIELRAPGADIVGFEHAAQSEADKAAVEKALSALREGTALFSIAPAAGCTQKQVDAEAGHDAVGERHKAGDGHAEFHVRYRFDCTAPDRLTHIDAHLFERFSSMREIEAQFITGRRQGAAELTPSSPRLTF